MLWLLIVGITFSSVFIAEMGDKSQLITISLASKYDNQSVFLGIFSGIIVITLLAVGLGTIVFQFIPLTYVKIGASIIFLAFGIYTLFSREKEEIRIQGKKENVVISSFLFSVFAELGDKTQLMVIALTARYSSPILVLLGALAGMGTIIGIGVFLGSKLGEFFKSEKIDLIAGSLFIIIGIAFLLETLFFG
ncbi:MAG: TMEM165/GDT1 family protein [Candidatus Thermoplasmatota archaeon]